MLILEEISRSRNENITQILIRISKEKNISLSTLKLNARILKDLELINFVNGRPVILTSLGSTVLSIISRSSSIGRAVGCKPTDPGSSLGSEIRGENNDRSSR